MIHERGMRLLGLMARKLGANCSPAPMVTGKVRYGSRHSSSRMLMFQPLGVGQ